MVWLWLTIVVFFFGCLLLSMKCLRKYCATREEYWLLKRIDKEVRWKNWEHDRFMNATKMSARSKARSRMKFKTIFNSKRNKDDDEEEETESHINAMWCAKLTESQLAKHKNSIDQIKRAVNRTVTGFLLFFGWFTNCNMLFSFKRPSNSMLSRFGERLTKATNRWPLLLFPLKKKKNSRSLLFVCLFSRLLSYFCPCKLSLISQNDTMKLFFQ